MRNLVLAVAAASAMLAACAQVDDGYGLTDAVPDTLPEFVDDGTGDPAFDPDPDTGIDTGLDTGIDTGIDTGWDTGFDTGLDTGVDTGWDWGLDTGTDTGVDTGIDTGWDTGVDTGTDTGFDSGWDSGIDTGTDTGFDPGLDTAVDTAVDTVTDPGTGWGVPVCGAGTTISDRGSYSNGVAIPALGIGRVMRLDIDIPDRVFFGVQVPFDDLVVTLTSPTGVSRVFWKNFASDDTGTIFPNYAFPAVWLMPPWWETAVGGTWTLNIQDTELSFTSTVLASWCLTPLDPSVYASTPLYATLNACASDHGSVPDCDDVTPDCPGVAVFETQVADLVKASGIPQLAINVSHSDPTQLYIELTGANGFSQVIWNHAPGPITSPVPITGMIGDWMTGRYQLRVEDNVAGSTGSVSSWCIQAN